MLRPTTLKEVAGQITMKETLQKQAAYALGVDQLLALPITGYNIQHFYNDWNRSSFYPKGD